MPGKDGKKKEGGAKRKRIALSPEVIDSHKREHELRVRLGKGGN